jgi:glucose uptake protein
MGEPAAEIAPATAAAPAGSAAGVLVAARPHTVPAATSLGLVGAIGAGLLWGSYFVPIQLAETSLWTANLSLAAGMTVGGSALVVITGGRLRLDRARGYAALAAAGGLWGLGNIGMLLLVEQIGTGKGFAIAQLSLVVNAVVGIVAFRDPRPRSRAAAVTFMGIALAVVGGVLLGQLK